MLAETRILAARSRKKAFKGFTLVELIVVITILAILATVGFLSLSGYSDDARMATVKANVRTVYSAILTESTTSGNSPRYYVSHDATAALSGAFVFVDGKQVALTGGNVGEVPADSNYSAGNPRWDRLRMNGEKFRLSSGSAGAGGSGLPYAFGGFGTAGIAGFAGPAQDANAAYSTGELAVGAFDVFKVGANGKRRNLPVFQVAGVASGSKTAVVSGNYAPGAGAGVPSLVRDPSSANPAVPLVDSAAVTIAGDEASGRKWSDGTFAKSCLEYASSPAGKAYAGSVGDGTYWVDPDGAGGGAEFKVHCDMAKDGGGWTLVFNQKGSAYTKFAAQNAAQVVPASAGSHSAMARIFSVASEFRWTDSAGIRFMQGRTDMPVWYSKFTTQACNSNGNTIDVRFENGWMNTATSPRKVEACTNYPFGMRNNMTYAPFKDVPGYDNATTHMCWFDDNLLDRPFATSHDGISSDRAYCTQFGYPFTTAATRGGTMDYMVWVR